MKKNIFILAGVVVIAASVLFACKKKQDDTIKPTYKDEAGTASNPNPNNVTVTGTNTTTPPPTENSSFNVGGGGWSNPSCITTSSLYLKANDGTTEVTVTFAIPPSIGQSTYQVATNPGANTCVFTVHNAPNQPKDVMWYGRSGVLTVNTTTSSVNAQITTAIRCEQSTFKFPSVTVTGVLGCN
jgi:hypothetical protein